MKTLDRVSRVVIDLFRSYLKAPYRDKIIEPESPMTELFASLDGYDGLMLSLALEEEFQAEGIIAHEDWNYCPCRKPIPQPYTSEYSTIGDYCQYFTELTEEQISNNSNQ